MKFPGMDASSRLPAICVLNGRCLDLAKRLGGLDGLIGDFVEQKRHLLKDRQVGLVLCDLIDVSEERDLIRDHNPSVPRFPQPASQLPTAFERGKPIERIIELRPALAIQFNG